MSEPKFQLRRGGYAIRKSQTNAKEKKKLMKDLHVVPRVKGGISGIPPQSFPIYRESLTRFYVPRHYGMETFGKPQSNVLSAGTKCPRLVFGGSLRDKQKPVVKIFQESNGGGVIAVPCGFGKTCCAIYLACWLKRKTLVVVHKNFLLSQWVERIQQFCPTARIGRIQGKVVDIEDKDIVIGMLQSLSQKDYEPKLFKEFGFTIIDECFPFKQNVITKNGNIAIGELYNSWNNKQVLPKVKSFNKTTKQFEYKQITHAWEKPYEADLIHLKVGRNVYKSTPNHKYLSSSGWKQANELQVGDRIISNIDFKDRKNFYRVLNDDQLQIVLGSYLGDGNIQTFKHNVFRMKILHSIDQKDYCSWKSTMFQSDITYIDKNGYSKKPAIKFNTDVYCLSDKSISFPKKSETIPKWIIDAIDIRAIAIWFMDDGSLNNSSYSISLHSQSFNKESQVLLINKLKTFGIDSKYYICKKKDKQYYYIRINKVNTIKFILLIKPYLHPTMYYKIFTSKYQKCILNKDCKYYNPYTIPKDKLNLNQIYTIYRQNETSYPMKYIHCEKCDKSLFVSSNMGYYYCRHNKKPDKKYIEADIFNRIKNNINKYSWNNKFQNYGYITVDRIIFKKTKCKVYDIEVEDNHNFIICGDKSTYGPVVHNCHHIGAEVFSRALPILGSKWNLGLSATPDRMDGLSKVFYWHLGPLLYPQKSDIIVKPTTEKEEHSTQCIVKKIEYYHEDPSYSQEPETAQGRPNTARIITQICEWHRRNIMILEIIRMCIEQKRVILLLSDRRQMLDHLQQMITRKFPTTSVGQYVGGMKQRLLDESAKCDIILSTYAMSSEGMDIPRINTVILASPKSNVEQSVGRAQRKIHEHGVWLFDIVDMFSLFPKQWERRKAFYRKFVVTDSYKKQRYPIEQYRVNDEHNKPIDLLASALRTPIVCDKKSRKVSKKTPDGHIEIPSGTLTFVEEAL